MYMIAGCQIKYLIAKLLFTGFLFWNTWGASGINWETDDAIIIEGVDQLSSVDSASSNAQQTNPRLKRQMFPGFGGGIFPPGWPFAPSGGGPVSIFHPQFPQVPGINIQHITNPAPTTPPPVAGLGPCLTNNGLQGYCASFRQCFPILYSPEDGQIMNHGLAEMYQNVSGPCNGNGISNTFMFRADAELRQNQICCGTGVGVQPQPSLPLGYPPQNIFHIYTMRPPVRQTTTITTTTTQRPTQPQTQWTWTPTATTARPLPPSTTTAASYPPVQSSCGVSKVVGGAQATKGDFPWLVALVKNGRQVCGGSLIDSQYILTAAHCFNGVTSYELQSLFKVYIGDYDLHSLTDGPMTVKSISKLILHRQFHQQYFYNDIALLKLESPVNFGSNNNNNIHPICLSAGGNYEGNSAWVAGWGRLTADSPYQPGTYRKVELKVWNLQQCAAKYGSQAPGGITSQMMCAGQLNKDSCLGDSGGPLMQRIGNRWEQIGLVSWGIGCGAYPGVYTKIADYQDWISRNRNY